MKQYFIPVLLLLGLLSAPRLFATEPEDYYLAVWGIDGKVTTFSLQEKPKVTYDENVFKLSTQSDEIELAESSIARFTLCTGQDISSVTDIKKETFVQWNNDRLVLSGFTPESDVLVSTVAGQRVCEARTDINGELTLELENYGKQLLIIKTKDVTFKILKK